MLRRLLVVSTVTALVVAGFVAGGRDGRMATYAGMIVLTAVSLWWFGFRPFRR